ncbi:MAG TPA: hypothetical protein EYG86_02660 [Crocinitomicaceae bacterium]|nr:hypothetical protein [Crocinitomicaceae bacterium]
MKVDKKFVQVGADALIPLLGFFLWNWSLYFILLFYFIDLFTNEFFYHLKSKRIIAFHQDKKQQLDWVKWSLISLVLLIGVVLLIHVCLQQIHPEIIFSNEVLAFWNYTELGIKQGYLLVPLIAFVGYQQYKMEFLLPVKYRTIEIKPLWKKHIQALLVMLAFTGLCIGISQFIILPEVVFVLGIVAVSILYNLKLNE